MIEQVRVKRPVSGVCIIASLVGFVFAGHAQPVSLSVQSSNGQTRVTWPAGLSLVQPQKRTNLTAGTWQDLGAATPASNLVETAGPGQGFYRLRFLAPNITAQPQSQTNSTGSNVSFSVTATGTGPLAYQWRKASMPLSGKTSATLGLTNLTTDDAGNYTVVITNRVSGITSVVAVLTVTNPVSRPVGIYMGSFAGQADNGGFALMVRSNGLAYVVGYNSPQEEGVFASGFSVAVNGTFVTTTAQNGEVGGTFTSASVSGNFTNSTGQTGTYSGNRKADSGIHASDAGYYSGTYSGFFQGSAFAILAADGSVFFYTIDDPIAPTSDGDGGGFGTINAANTLSGTTVPNGLTITGTLNPATKVITGSYSSGTTTLGTFSVTRTLTF